MTTQENTHDHEIFITAPLHKVWGMVTQPDDIKQWYAFDGATVDLKPGGEITFQWDEHGKYYGVIEDIEPDHRLAFRYVPFVADTKPDSTNSLIVTITLEPQSDGTKVKLTEAGYTQLNLPEGELSQNFEMNKGAWDNSLSLLKDLAEK